jgi:hypothetical protein
MAAKQAILWTIYVTDCVCIGLRVHNIAARAAIISLSAEYLFAILGEERIRRQDL